MADYFLQNVAVHSLEWKLENARHFLNAPFEKQNSITQILRTLCVVLTLT